MSRRLLSLIATLASIAVVASCTEQLEGGAACPVLCPQPGIELRDTIIEAVVLDSSLAGYPPIGFEERLLLTNRGDTLETRVVVRFDSVPNVYRTSGATTDSTLASVDSARLILRLQYPLIDSTASFTIDAYDVDTAVTGAADTAVATLRPLFRPDRLLGTITVNPAEITDSIVRVPLADSAILAKATGSQRLRIGLAIRGDGSPTVLLSGQGGPNQLALRFRPSRDTTVTALVVPPLSRTPTDADFLAEALADYQIIWRAMQPPAAGTLVVGGQPGRRTYLRFELPRNIVDSSRVVRATLILTQVANARSAQRGDTIRIAPEVLTASEALTSLERAVLFTSPSFPYQGGAATLAQLPLVPRESGVRTIEIAPLVLAWAISARDSVPRALVLRAVNEGQVGGTVLFHSREAADPALRPRVRLTYAPTLEFGLP